MRYLVYIADFLSDDWFGFHYIYLLKRIFDTYVLIHGVYENNLLVIHLTSKSFGYTYYSFIGIEVIKRVIY